MRLFVVFLSCWIFINALNCVAASQPLHRDLSSSAAKIILPPEFATKILSQSENLQDLAALSDDDYKYKRMRLLRSEISVLNLTYLPPPPPTIKVVESPDSREFLPTPPPHLGAENNSQSFTTAADITEPEVATLPAPLSNEYLQPAAEIEMATAATELPLLPTETANGFSEIPLETFLTNKEVISKEGNAAEQLTVKEYSGEVVDAPIYDAPDTVILAEDGYHYKIPDNIPDLFPSIKSFAAYLPPLEDQDAEAIIVSNDESSASKGDGYKYRTSTRHL